MLSMIWLLLCRRESSYQPMGEMLILMLLLMLMLLLTLCLGSYFREWLPWLRESDTWEVLRRLLLRCKALGAVCLASFLTKLLIFLRAGSPLRMETSVPLLALRVLCSRWPLFWSAQRSLFLEDSSSWGGRVCMPCQSCWSWQLRQVCTSTSSSESSWSSRGVTVQEEVRLTVLARRPSITPSWARTAFRVSRSGLRNRRKAVALGRDQRNFFIRYSRMTRADRFWLRRECTRTCSPCSRAVSRKEKVLARGRALSPRQWLSTSGQGRDKQPMPCLSNRLGTCLQQQFTTLPILFINMKSQSLAEYSSPMNNPSLIRMAPTNYWFII